MLIKKNSGKKQARLLLWVCVRYAKGDGTPNEARRRVPQSERKIILKTVLKIREL
jgi:hypothetical protein